MSGHGDVRALIEPLVNAAGFDLEDLVVRNAGRSRVMRIVIDRDGGVGLDDIGPLSTSISRALDEANAGGNSPYVLEVTSPGVDRPLTLPRHWRRARGRLVAADLADGRHITGRVSSSDDTGAELDSDGKITRISFDAVTRALVQVEFGRIDEVELADDGDDTGEGE